MSKSSVSLEDSDIKTSTSVKYPVDSKGERIQPTVAIWGSYCQVKRVMLLSITKDAERYAVKFSHKLPVDGENASHLYLTKAKFKALGYDDRDLVKLNNINMFIYSVQYHYSSCYISHIEEHKSENNNCCTLL